MRVGILARKSTDKQATSVERQIEDARRFAVVKGWSVVEACVFAVDEGVSGMRTDSPQILAARAEGRRRPSRIDALLVQSPDRMSRDMLALQVLVRDLNDSGLEVWCYSTDRKISTDTIMNQLMLALDGFSAASEREKIVGRTRDAGFYRARRGLVAGNRAYGYRNVRVNTDGRGFVDREINEEEAKWVRWMFEHYEAGDGFRSIAHELNRLGVPSPRSTGKGAKSWLAATIRPILLRSLYRGVQEYGAKRNTVRGGRRVVVKAASSELVSAEVPHLRLVDDALWHRVQALMKSRSSKLGKTCGRQPTALLVGNLVCGVCGGPMYVTGREKSFSCGARHQAGVQSCSNATRRPAKSLDDTFVAAVLGALDVDAVVDRVVADQTARKTTRVDVDQEIDALQKRREALTREIENLSTAIATASSAEAITLLVGMLQDRQKARAAIEDESKTRGLSRVVDTLDAAALRRRAQESVAQLAATLAGDVPKGRVALREILDGRATAIPIVVNGQRRFAIRGCLQRGQAAQDA